MEPVSGGLVFCRRPAAHAPVTGLFLLRRLYFWSIWPEVGFHRHWTISEIPGVGMEFGSPGVEIDPAERSIRHAEVQSGHSVASAFRVLTYTFLHPRLRTQSARYVS